MRLLGRALSMLFIGLVTLFLVLPVVPVLVSSFSGGAAEYIVFPPPSFSLRWYAGLSPVFLKALWTSTLVGTVAAFGSAILGVPAVIYLIRGSGWGREYLRGFMLLPLQVPWTVMGIAIMQFYFAIYDYAGQGLLDSLGGLILAHLLLGFPYIISTVEPVLARLDPRLEEAALSLGASPASTFRRVVLPLIMPGVYAGMIYAFVTSFGNVGLSLFLVGRNSPTLPVAIFQSLEYNPSPGVLAISAIVVLFSGVLVWVIQRYVGFDVSHGGVKGG